MKGKACSKSRPAAAGSERAPGASGGRSAKQAGSALSGNHDLAWLPGSSFGRPLPAETRAFFEPRFQHDFGKVKIHTDQQAAESARCLGARAFTFGQDIVMAAGAYRPASETGRGLLAHELAHTIQQGEADLGTGPLHISQPGDPSEKEASRAAGEAAAGRPATVALRNPGILARQPDPAQPDPFPWDSLAPKVPGPSVDLPEEEKFPEAHSRPRGREKSSVPSTWGWAAKETENRYQECTVAPMSRDRFISFEATLPKKAKRRSGPSQAGPRHPFGATWPDLKSAIPPEIDVESVQEGGETFFRVKPTHAEMPLIKSAHTEAGTFEEGDTPWTTKPECPSLRGRAPFFWQITEAGARKVRAGELEHCSDIRMAFDRTLATYASLINREAAAERRFKDAGSLRRFTQQRLQSDIPGSAVDMLNAYGYEIEKTRQRDTQGWHEGIVSRLFKPQESHAHQCRGYLGIFDDKSFPEVGDGPGKEKHPPEEIFDPKPPKP